MYFQYGIVYICCPQPHTICELFASCVKSYTANSASLNIGEMLTRGIPAHSSEQPMSTDVKDNIVMSSSEALTEGYQVASGHVVVTGRPR